MGPAALVLAWLLSIAPLVLERAGVLDLSAGKSDASVRLGAGALVWIALAGMPRASVGASDSRAWWGSCMAFLPVLTLATVLDLANGLAFHLKAVNAVLALLFVALSALAADLARRRLRSQRVHAALWFACILGAPLFAAAFSWGARPAASQPPAWASIAANFSPLQWAFGSMSASQLPFAAPAAFATLVAMCAIASLTSRGEVA